jgi:uncharacterized protein YndB with AHSA1/START domain
MANKIKKQSKQVKKQLEKASPAKKKTNISNQVKTTTNPVKTKASKASSLAKKRNYTPAQASDKKAFEDQSKSPEPKNKLVLEYIIHAAQYLLYEYISSPSGLSEWFADDVNINGNVYTFFWDGAQQFAKVLEVKENKSIRFQWTDRKPDTYFELRIDKNELTEELSLIITDFAETADEKNSLEVLWQGQVAKLMHVIGSKV